MEFFLATVSIILFVVCNIAHWLYNSIQRTKPPGIPPSKNPLLQLSATTLAKRIRHGELTSEEVVVAYIARIKEVNPMINAVVDERFDAALREAKECDAKLRAGEVTVVTLERDKPLYGVPITVKESCAVKGMSHTGCTLPRKNVRATEHCTVVQRLLDAGAIPLCVTNTPEMCSSINSVNYVYGTTNNPYDGRLTAGGSSGGEGAIIAAGASVMGIGSDLAGSIRIPALYNGIFGHKPTPGVVPLQGHFPLSTEATFQRFLVIGPMTRYAEDLLVAMKVLTGNAAELRLDEPVNVSELKMFYIDEVPSIMGLRTPTPDIKQAISDAVNHLVNSGAKLQDMPKHWLHDIHNTVIGVFFGVPNAPKILLDPNDLEKEKSAVCEMVKSLFGLSTYTLPNIIAKTLINLHGFIPRSRQSHYQIVAEDLKLKLTNLLGDNGILIYPTYSVPAFNKKMVLHRSDSITYCMAANILQFPATHVPMGLNKNGIPVGFQVMAGPNQDRLCLAAALELEKKFGGWRSPISD